jgi:hypothetical protein
MILFASGSWMMEIFDIQSIKEKKMDFLFGRQYPKQETARRDAYV